jgi:hypothetical protein
VATLPFTCTTAGTITVLPVNLANLGWLRVARAPIVAGGVVDWVQLVAGGIVLTLAPGDQVVQRINGSLWATHCAITLGTAT